MEVNVAEGILSGPQAGKSAVPAAYHRHKAVDVDLGIMDDVRWDNWKLVVPRFRHFRIGWLSLVAASIQLGRRYRWLVAVWCMSRAQTLLVMLIPG
jgi:hypothetical protein